MPDRPRFEDLQPGTSKSGTNPELRWVGKILMSRDQYDEEGWERVSSYEVYHPHRPGCLLAPRKVEVWRARLSGLQDRSKRLHEEKMDRIYAARTRYEQEEEFRRDVVDQGLDPIDHDDSKPTWRTRREG